MLQEALSALSEEDTALRARVLAQLSLALYYSPEARDDLNQQAVEMARRVNDPAAIVAALHGKHLISRGHRVLKNGSPSQPRFWRLRKRAAIRRWSCRFAIAAFWTCWSWRTWREWMLRLKHMLSWRKNSASLATCGLRLS